MGQTIYLVDHENVSDYGLKGIDKLNKCKVIIFYSNDSKVALWNSLLSAYAKRNVISYEKLVNPGKNSLDFMLTTRLGFEAKVSGSRDIFIVSQDNGYKSAIYEVSRLNPEISCAVIPSIEESFNIKKMPVTEMEANLTEMLKSLQVDQEKIGHVLGVLRRYEKKKLDRLTAEEKIAFYFGKKHKDLGETVIRELNKMNVL